MRDPLPTNHTMRFRARQRAAARKNERETSNRSLAILFAATNHAEKLGYRQGVDDERKRVTEFRTLQSDRNRLDTAPRHQYIEYPIYSEPEVAYGSSVATNSSYRVIRFRAVENAISAEGRVFRFTSWVLDR